MTDTRQTTIFSGNISSGRYALMFLRWEKMVVISNGNYGSDKSASGRINFVRFNFSPASVPGREVSLGIFHPNFKLSVVYTTRTQRGNCNLLVPLCFLKIFNFSRRSASSSSSSSSSFSSLRLLK